MVFFSKPNYLYRVLFSINLYGLISHGVLLYLKHSGSPTNYISERHIKGYIAFNILVLLVFVFQKKRVLIYLEKFSHWYNQVEYKRERSILSLCLLGIFSVYTLKLRTGFYFSGISGWVSSNSTERYKTGPLEASVPTFKDKKYPDYFFNAIDKKLIKDLPFEFNQLAVKMQFLYFKDKVLPYDLNLTPFAFDEIILNSLKEKGKLTDFKKVIEKSLQNRGVSWRTPNYISYLDNRNIKYPPFKELQKFSTWSVIFHIDRTKEVVKIINATERIKIEF